MARKITKKAININMDALIAPLKKENLRPSAGREQAIGEFYFLDTSELLPYPNQARKSFDDEELNALAETIKKHGIRQPLTVSKISGVLGQYYVLSGERRLRAAKLIGLQKIPCIILDDLDNADEIALIENLQRKDLHPLEVAKALSEIMTHDKSLSQADLAKGVGLSKKSVSELLTYLALPESIQKVLLDKSIYQRIIFRRLLKCNNELAMKRMLGVERHTNGRSRKRNIFNIYIEDGECGFKKGNVRLTVEEKVKLIDGLENMINEIKNS